VLGGTIPRMVLAEILEELLTNQKSIRGGRGRRSGVSLGTVERVDHEPDLNTAFPLRSSLA
jgi:hypothetical protein